MQTQEKPRDHWTDREFILAHGQDAQELGKPYFLGDLMRPGWTGRIPTYLVWCEDCQYRENRGFTVAHEAGYDRRIACATCRVRFDRKPLALPVVLLLAAAALILIVLMLR